MHHSPIFNILNPLSLRARLLHADCTRSARKHLSNAAMLMTAQVAEFVFSMWLGHNRANPTLGTQLGLKVDLAKHWKISFRTSGIRISEKSNLGWTPS